MDTHRDRYPIRVGALVWPQQATWDEISEMAVLADEVGVDSVWTWDHLHAIVGDPMQPIFEGWSLLAAWAAQTKRIELGLMVGANTFRNPGLTAKVAVTVDHISGGRTWLGIGGAWFEFEHRAHGIDFGTGFGQRLDWLDEAVSGMRDLFAGQSVTSDTDGRYRFQDLRHLPLPIRGAGRLPIMIGGSGERKTLRTVARYADAWNGGGDLETLTHKVDVLRRHCETESRDMLEIELTMNRYCILRDDRAEAERVLLDALAHNGRRYTVNPSMDFLGPEEEVAELWRRYLALGFTHVIMDVAAPFDRETMGRLPKLRELVAAG